MIYRYYLEIKNRCILLLLTWTFSVFICYIYKEILLFLCVKPSLILYNNDIFYFIFTDIQEIFSMYFKLIFTITNQIFIFYFLLHLFIFISLGLYKFEYNYFKKKIYFIVFLWICSLFILHNILLPISLNFFLSFQNFYSFKTLNLHFEAKLAEYLNFYLLFYYICTLYCQLFIILTFFFDYLNLNLIKKYRKIIYYFFVFFSTLITPPDIFSQVLFAIVLVFFYELLIFINLFYFFLTKIN